MKIRYIGTSNYQEYPVTGTNALWQPEWVSDVSDSRATALVALGTFVYEDDSTYAKQLLDHAAEHAAMGVPTNNLIVGRRVNNVAMSIPPTVTSNAAATITAQRYFTSGNVLFAGSSYGSWFNVSRSSPTAFSSAGGLYTKNVTLSPAPTYGATLQQISFMHYGSAFELYVGGTSTYFTVRVDDEYVSMTPNLASSTLYWKYDFGAAALRRIDIIAHNSVIYGVNIGATDFVYPAPVRGPRVIFIGDSWVYGTGSGYDSIAGLVMAFADRLGWDDVWASGVGGTGILANNSGSATTFRERLQHDVLQYAPDMVVVVGGLNDSAYSASALATEGNLLFSEIRAALPVAKIGYVYNSSKAVYALNNTQLEQRDALMSCAADNGVYGLDITNLSYPWPGIYPQTTTVRDACVSGAGTVNFTNAPMPGTTYMVGSSPTRECVYVKSYSQTGSDRFSATLDGVTQYAHAALEPVMQVGCGVLIGTGRVGATSGFGMRDIAIGNDNSHPTRIGHELIGNAIAEEVIRKII